MKPFVLKKTRDLGDLISDTFTYIRIHFKSLSLSLLFFALPILIISGFFMGNSFTGLMNATLAEGQSPQANIEFVWKMLTGIFFMSVSYLLVQAIVYKHIALVNEDRDSISPKDLLDELLPNILGLLGISMVTGFIVAAGFMLFFFPGIYLAIKLILAPAIYIIDDDTSAMKALGESWRATDGYWWFTMGFSAVMYFIVSFASNIFVIPFYISMFFIGFTIGDTSEGVIGAGVGIFYGLLILATSLLSSITYISLALLYFNLGERKDASNLRAKIEELGE